MSENRTPLDLLEGKSDSKRLTTSERTNRSMRWSVLFSSKRQDWATPQDLFRELDNEFRFSLDACATSMNAKCRRYFSPTQDGLHQDWGRERVWCNPPYDDIRSWLAKGHQSAQRGALCVFLIPARTDTIAWHEHVMQPNVEVRFIQGRLRFGNATNAAPFPSVLVIFRPPIVRPVQLSLFDNTTGAEEVR